MQAIIAELDQFFGNEPGKSLFLRPGHRSDETGDQNAG
jgi:hypothetical protein